MSSEQDGSDRPPGRLKKGLQKAGAEANLDLRSSDDLWARRLDRNEAKKLAAEIQRSGETSFTLHSRDALKDDNMTTSDAANILRCGKITRQPEEKFGAYRYVVETDRMAVTIEIRSRTSLRVITAWRKKP